MAGSETEARAERPDLGVVVVCAAGGWRVRRTLAALAAQTAAHGIEVTLVTPDPPEVVAEREARLLSYFHSHSIRHEPTIDNVDFTVGRYLLESRAPVVAGVEDHAFPDPAWAEGVLAQFAADPGCVAVGSAFTNANPASGASWAVFLVAFGPWSERATAGAIRWIQLHNTAYRRAALEALAAELPDGSIWPLFNRESEILLRLRERGGSFRFAPDAVLLHLNASSWATAARLRFHAGRLTAAGRQAKEGWAWPRRLLYFAGGPLIPFVRYVRMRSELFGRIPGAREARHGPALFFALASDAVGQMTAFLAGPGEARMRLAEHELDRISELNRADARNFGPLW